MTPTGVSPVCAHGVRQTGTLDAPPRSDTRLVVLTCVASSCPGGNGLLWSRRLRRLQWQRVLVWTPQARRLLGYRRVVRASGRVAARRLAVGAAAALPFAAGPAPVSLAANSMPLSQLVHAAIVDGTREASARVTSVAQPLAFSASDDIALQDGRQTLIVRKPFGTVLVMVIGATAYISATNPALLVETSGFTKSTADKAGTRWVDVPSSSKLYAGIALNVTLPSELASVAPGGQLTALASSMYQGERVVGIRGTANSATP
jgi:hypothetical protein